MLSKIEDPANNADFYADEDGMCYHDTEGKEKMYCTVHTDKQVSHNEGWIVCEKCEPDNA